MHGVAPLEYDRTLEEFAMKRVRYMAQTDIFAHPKRLPYGENLYWKSGRVPSCKNALDMWYREKKHYNYSAGNFSPATGHFTQMVWAGSQYVGCASAKSRKSGRIYIAVSTGLQSYFYEVDVRPVTWCLSAVQLLATGEREDAVQGQRVAGREVVLPHVSTTGERIAS